MLIDAPQHIWTEPLLAKLSQRDRLPLVRYEDGLTVLHCAAEQAYVIDVEAEAPARRAAGPPPPRRARPRRRARPGGGRDFEPDRDRGASSSRCRRTDRRVPRRCR